MIHHMKYFFLLFRVVPTQRTTWKLSLYGGLIRNRAKVLCRDREKTSAFVMLCRGYFWGSCALSQTKRTV